MRLSVRFSVQHDPHIVLRQGPLRDRNNRSRPRDTRFSLRSTGGQPFFLHIKFHWNISRFNVIYDVYKRAHWYVKFTMHLSQDLPKIPITIFLTNCTAISTSRVLLVPYEASHVPTYHKWMKDPVISTLIVYPILALTPC